MALPR
jgi:hypothetical protein